MKNPKLDIPTHFKSEPLFEEMGTYIINGDARGKSWEQKK